MTEPRRLKLLLGTLASVFVLRLGLGWYESGHDVPISTPADPLADESQVVGSDKADQPTELAPAHHRNTQPAVAQLELPASASRIALSRPVRAQWAELAPDIFTVYQPPPPRRPRPKIAIPLPPRPPIMKVVREPRPPAEQWIKKTPQRSRPATVKPPSMPFSPLGYVEASADLRVFILNNGKVESVGLGEPLPGGWHLVTANRLKAQFVHAERQVTRTFRYSDDKK